MLRGREIVRTCADGVPSARITDCARMTCEARIGSVAISADLGRYFELQHPSLRGRRPVRADHRLCTDEKHIRAQSAILYSPKLPLLLSRTVFLVRMRFSSVPKTWLARAARNGRPWHATAFTSSYIATLYRLRICCTMRRRIAASGRRPSAAPMLSTR